MTHPSTTSLLAKLAFQYGPAELLSRFFLKAIQAVNQRGLSLHVGNFTQLEEVNEANREHWRPLFPSFSPTTGGVDNADGFVIFGIDQKGRVRATQAARLFHWPQSNLANELTSLRLMYSNPHLMPEGEECEVIDKTMPGTVKGRVSLGGAIWYHPDYRGKQFAELFPRLTRAYALATYNTEHHLGFFAPDAVKRGIPQSCGFREDGATMIMRNSASYPDKDVTMSIMRSGPHDIIDDLFLYLLDWESHGR